MTGRRRGPPVLAERLLAAALRSPEQREGVAGDLYEEYMARARVSPMRASRWYWFQAIRIAARLGAGATFRHVGAPATGPSEIPPPGDSIMRTIGLEIRHAVKAISRRPAFAGIVVVTLALGLGANAAVFAMIDALVLRPFTARDVDRIVLLSQSREGEIDRQQTVSPANFLDWKRQSDVFAHLAAIEWWEANLVGRDEPEAALGFKVSADFFSTMGVQPALGQAFASADETPGQDRRVVLNHDLWRRRFAGDPAIIGATVRIDGSTYEVAGIAPEGFDFPMAAQLWAPLAFDAESAANRKSRYLTVVGRLAPGRTLDDARAQMAVINDRLAGMYPDTNRGFDVRVHTLAQGMLDVGLGPILSLWQASAIFVLLIACANVASLLLARGAERQREMAVRLAIGASRARVVRESLIEASLVALAAVPAALALAWLGLYALRAAMPARLVKFVAGWHEIDVDGRLIAFTVLLAVGTAVIAGLIPALQAARPRLAETLKEGGRSSTAGGSRVRLRRGLVIAELALALPLLVTCGLSALGVHRFLNGPQGYNPDRLLTLQVVLAPGTYPDEGARLRYAERAVQQVSSVAGVESAAAVNNMPSHGGNSSRSIEISGHPNPDPANPPRVDYRVATPAFFRALELPILAGRGLQDADRENTQPVVVISESLARRYWPDADPIGRQLKLGDGPWLTVVGVCGDVIHNWFARRNFPTVYRPFAQAPAGRMALLVRTAGEPSAAAGEVRRALRRVDDVQPIFDVMTMREVLIERTIGLRFVAAIMAAFGGMALLLAVIGVYGVMAFLVTQRTHEIGVRMALGATRADVLRLTVGQTGRLTAIGAAVGVALALALGRAIEAGLLGVMASDLRVLAGFTGVLVAAALAAGYIPARRAATVSPIVALRGE